MKYDGTYRRWWERVLIYRARDRAWRPWCWRVRGGGGAPLEVRRWWFF